MGNESKNISMLDRLNLITKAQSKLNKADSLLAKSQFHNEQYAIAFTEFYRAIQSANPNTNLQLVTYFFFNPFDNFYVGSKKKLECFFSFNYGSEKETQHLTRKGLSAFLKNVCSIPKIPVQETDKFYNDLTDYLAKFPHITLNKITNDIKIECPAFLEFFSRCIFLQCNNDKNLYLCNINSKPYYSAKEAPFISALLFENLFNNPKFNVYLNEKHKKRFFRVFIQVQNNPIIQGNPYSLNTIRKVNSSPETDLPHLHYYSPSRHESSCFVFDADNDRITMQSTTDYLPNQKVIRKPRGYTDSKTVQNFFHVICGGNSAKIDELAILFYKLMHPGKQEFQVIYTKKHKKELIDFFSEPIDTDSSERISVLFRTASENKAYIPSLNQLTKNSALKSLFYAQVQQANYVQVTDCLPTDESIKKIKKLLKGTPFPIKSAILPSQSYKNHLGIICITDNLSTAKKLQKALNANIVDITGVESSDQQLIDISFTSIPWFFTTFIPYGLRLSVLASNPNTSLSPPIKKNPSLSIEKNLTDFWTGCCKRVDGAFCTTTELYKGFCEYWAVTHSGSPMEYTERKLNKMFREVTGLTSLDRKHSSRKEPSLRGYKGIQLCLAPVSPSLKNESSPAPEEPISQIDDLNTYMEHINRYRIRL